MEKPLNRNIHFVAWIFHIIEYNLALRTTISKTFGKLESIMLETMVLSVGIQCQETRFRKLLQTKASDNNDFANCTGNKQGLSREGKAKYGRKELILCNL